MGKYEEVLRPFLALMEKELHANAGKGDRPGWLKMDGKTAILEVFYHMGKLHQAVHRGEAEAIKEYAADVANMCMMLVDVCGFLPVDEQPAPVAVAMPDLSELREYHADAVKQLNHYADDSGLRESDVKHYRKRAEFHARQVALIDSLNPIKP